jgi:hypothetical protein
MCGSVKESAAFLEKFDSYVDKINHIRNSTVLPSPPPPNQWKKYFQTLNPKYNVVLRLSQDYILFSIR